MSERVDGRYQWVDVAKGICIILVVLMHSTLGVEKATGGETPLHAFIDWARPFRMPDFFLISGLFLAARIDRPWRAYADTKVAHFAYFYVLWLTIQFALKAPAMIAEQGAVATMQSYFVSFIDPFGTLWFIYLLAVFFVTTKLARNVPKPLVFAAAAALHLLAPKTGYVVPDEFTDRFVFFYSGYALAPLVFAYADRLSQVALPAIAGGLVAWGVANAAAVQHGIAVVPGLDLIVSYIGIGAVVAVSVMLTGLQPGAALAYCGRHSIAIYLAFTVFMGPARIVLLKLLDGSGNGTSGAVVALVATAAGVAGSLLLRWAVSETPLAFLFVRPQRFRLASSAAARPPREARSALA